MFIFDEEDWEFFDKDEIEDILNIFDEIIENNELVLFEFEVWLYDLLLKLCVFSEDVNLEFEEDIIEIVDRFEICDIESLIEFK